MAFRVAVHCSYCSDASKCTHFHIRTVMPDRSLSTKITIGADSARIYDCLPDLDLLVNSPPPTHAISPSFSGFAR